jgi:Trypsin-co-occurring domain 2
MILQTGEGIAMALTETEISLPELAAALRRDLEKAQANLQAGGKEAILNLESAEIELNISIGTTKGGGGGVNLSVLGVGVSGGGKYEGTTATGHKLKLVLKPGHGDVVGVAGRPDKP